MSGVTPLALLRGLRGAFVLACLAFAGAVSASESVVLPYTIDTNLRDLASLQRGWKLYTNYCLGCHSLKYQRYERTADDLKVPHQLVLDNLVFTGQQIGGLMQNSIPDDSKNWFGAPPPDLTMVDRVRGSSWIYSYLKSFYLDESRPFGVNNEVFHNVGMPHVLIELQGVQRKTKAEVPKVNEYGGEMRDPLIPGKKVTELKDNVLVVEPGTGRLTPQEYDQAVYDIVNFLHYVGDPSRLQRQRIGVYVLLFLIVLYVFTYLLGREYDKDWH